MAEADGAWCRDGEAMTAVSIDTGKVLWQIGEPIDDDSVYELTTDLPYQVYDIDGDGIDEVITAMDFQVKILDGRNGNIKKTMQDISLNRKFSIFTGKPIRQCRVVPLSIKGKKRAFLALYSSVFDVDPYVEMFFFPDDSLHFMGVTQEGFHTFHPV